MVGHFPLECNTWEETFYIYACSRHAKVLTISHATYSSIACPATCEWQILGQSLARLHCLPQILGSRGKRIHFGSWRRVHPQYCEGHAVDMIVIHDQPPLKEYGHPTSIVGSSLTWMDYDGIECTVGNEEIPDHEYPTDQTCRSLDSLLYRRLSARSKFSRHLLFQWWAL